MDAAYHRGEVRHKRKANLLADNARQPLPDLRQMPMSSHAISFEVIRRLGEQSGNFRLASGTGHTRLGIGNQAARVNHARFQQRDKSQLHRRRITTGVGNQPRRFGLYAINFRQPINGLAHQIGTGVRHAIPFFPYSDILQAEVGGQVNHLHARIQQCPRLLHGNTIRGGKEHQIALIQMRLIRMGERQIHKAAQAGEHLTDRCARIGARRNHLQRNLRMPCQQAQQLHAGIACTTHYANFYHSGFLQKCPSSYNKTPMQKPPEGGFCRNTSERLTLGELFPAASLAQADFLAFHFARIAGHQAGLFQHRLELGVVIDQRTGDTVTHRTCLA